VGSAFGFALMGMFVRLADDFGGAIPFTQKSFFRNIVAVAVAGVVFSLKWRETSSRGSGAPPASSWWPLVWRSVFGTIGIFGNFYALSHIPLGDACMLNKLSPFAAVVASWALLHERVTLRQGVAVVIAFAGAMFVVKPGFALAGETTAALAGLAGGIAAGLAYTCVRRLGILKVEPSFIVLFFSCFSTLITVPFLVFDYHPMTWAQVATLFGAGVSATIGQFGITAAYRLAQPRELAVYDYTNVVFAALLGFAVFGQVPDLFSWIGIAIIVAMGVLMRMRVPGAEHQ
jgi:drug/metabolite transporter (DMT)-like permease